MRAPTANEIGPHQGRRRSAVGQHGGKRPGAGRPKGSTKLRPEQEFDVFSYIEEQCERREPRRFGRRRLVSGVCKWIAENVTFRWIAGSGRTIAIADRYSARSLETLYYRVRRRFRDAGWRLRYVTEVLGDERGHALMRSGPADRSPEPRRRAVMIVERRRSK
jgi:hypothetical protein